MLVSAVTVDSQRVFGECRISIALRARSYIYRNHAGRGRWGGGGLKRHHEGKQAALLIKKSLVDPLTILNSVIFNDAG